MLNRNDTGERPRWMPWAAGIAILAAGIAIGSLFLGGRSAAPETETVSAEAPATIWTCSMHPQIRLPNPGKCPICGMDLIPLETGGESDAESHGLSMSPESMKLAEIQTVPVTRQFPEMEVRTVGKVTVEERRLRKITAWVGGRLDRLYVDYTGVAVEKGDHLAEIYSPELYSTQAELIEAQKAKTDLDASSMNVMKQTAEGTVTAAREKLRLLGLTEDQVAEIETQQTPHDHVTLYAPIGGIVVHKNALEGDYVTPGSTIYTIADLSKVWVLLDVYESDLVWVHYGQAVEFEVEAYPGETFTGRISFIDPVVDPRTRTVKVRVNVDNPRQRLKPDMFVRAVIRSTVVGDGKTLAPDLAGKWICSMHPEIVKDHPGTCDICGMKLVTASQLGLVTNPDRSVAPLVIPATAPLITGKRSVVYVKVPGMEMPTFEGREVVLGPRAGKVYTVVSGLEEGEEVVVKGNFKIDSAMQIQARSSMMNPGKPAAPATSRMPGMEMESGDAKGSTSSGAGLADAPPAFRDGVHGLVAAYLVLQEKLARDDLPGAREALESLDARLDALSPAGLDAGARTAWDGVSRDLSAALTQARGASDLHGVRSAFGSLTTAVLVLEKAFGPPTKETHRLLFCPMAFNNQGAFWLQTGDAVRNPYFGSSMLTCGEVRETFTGKNGGND